MMLDAVRGYWALASGLTEVSRQKATAAARALVGQGEATAEQVTAIVEDLLSTSMSNRAALANIVRLEVDRARSAMGVVTSAELQVLTDRVGALESQLTALAAARPAPAKTSPAKTAPAKTSPAKKAAATKTPATKTPATKTPAKKTPATKTPATKTPAKKTPAKKAAGGSSAGSSR